MSNKQTKYLSEIEKIDKEYFHELVSHAWAYIDDKNEDAGADYVIGCLDKLASIAEIIKEHFETRGEIEDIFARFYNQKKIKEDHSELVYLLRDLESSIHYGVLNISERENVVDFEDIMNEMETVFTDLKSLKPEK